MQQLKMVIGRNCAMYYVHYEGSNTPLFKSLKRINCVDFIVANTPQQEIIE